MKWREMFDDENFLSNLATIVSINLIVGGLILGMEIAMGDGMFYLHVIFVMIIITFLVTLARDHFWEMLILSLATSLTFLWGLVYLFEISLLVGILGVIGIFIIGEIVFFMDKKKPKKFRMAWVYKDTKKELKFWDRFGVWLNEPSHEEKPKKKKTRKEIKSKWAGFKDWLEADDISEFEIDFPKPERKVAKTTITTEEEKPRKGKWGQFMDWLAEDDDDFF